MTGRLLKKGINLAYSFILCSFRKYPYPSERGARGGGVSKAKIFKRKYESKLEFPERGWGGDENPHDVDLNMYLSL